MFKPTKEQLDQQHRIARQATGMPSDSITLTLNINEADAILNALRETGVLNAPLVFDHVRTLADKVRAALLEAGHNPL